MESFVPSPEEDAEFAAEIKRRIAEIESGAVKTIPWEDSQATLGEVVIGLLSGRTPITPRFHPRLLVHHPPHEVSDDPGD